SLSPSGRRPAKPTGRSGASRSESRKYPQPIAASFARLASICARTVSRGTGSSSKRYRRTERSFHCSNRTSSCSGAKGRSRSLSVSSVRSLIVRRAAGPSASIVAEHQGVDPEPALFLDERQHEPASRRLALVREHEVGPDARQAAVALRACVLEDLADGAARVQVAPLGAEELVERPHEHGAVGPRGRG